MLLRSFEKEEQIIFSQNLNVEAEKTDVRKKYWPVKQLCMAEFEMPVENCSSFQLMDEEEAVSWWSAAESQLLGIWYKE